MFSMIRAMQITHRIALDPTNKQETLLRQHAGYARFAWDWGVEESRRALKAGESGATRQERLRPRFNMLKPDLAPWHGLLSQNAAKYALMALGETWGRHWSELDKAKKAGKKCEFGRPRFKSRKRSKASFRADNGPGTVKCSGKHVRLPKIGKVRMREARRFAGPVRECTVTHDGVRWYGAFVYEIPDPEPKAEGAVVGVDVGLRRLMTVHDGESVQVIENPRPFAAAQGRIRRVNRGIERSKRIHGKDRPSKRRERRYAERRRLYRRATALRMDAAHKATTAIAKRSRVVCVENLHVKGWMRNRRLSRSTADASPGRILRLVIWKCRREGAALVEVGRFYPSSRRCSSCGCVNAGLKMEERWTCPACGVRHQRDDNAALNLRRQEPAPDLIRGLAADAEGMSDGQEAAVPGEASTRRLVCIRAD